MRLSVNKTYKMYVNGAFIRSESGRSLGFERTDKTVINYNWASKKDLRDAIKSAATVQSKWAAKTAFNRGQILYRIAEVLESRFSEFTQELILAGVKQNKAEQDVQQAIDLCVYYSGWCDKFQAVFSSVNPISGNYFNFSAYEPVGVVCAYSNTSISLYNYLQLVLPIIASGNTIVTLSQNEALLACAFAEVLNASDVPAGVVNCLTGKNEELAPEMAKHMAVKAIVQFGEENSELEQKVKLLGAETIKRLHFWPANIKPQPYNILDLCEVKTTWHPIDAVGSASSSY